MMKDWNGYRTALLARVGDFAKRSPDVLRGLTTIENAAIKSGKL
ncbi:MAG TPA: carboxymuconolactone decarboxylase family protein, partial [Paraburkholderia sp.]|nr:carboxymuconolactone decarboxylase family protein [Paraburkholderia sp.]